MIDDRDSACMMIDTTKAKSTSIIVRPFDEIHGQSRSIVMGPFGPDILPRFAIILSDGCHENNYIFM